MTPVIFGVPVSRIVNNYTLEDMDDTVSMLIIDRQICIYLRGHLGHVESVQMMINMVSDVTADTNVRDTPDTGLGKICVHQDARIYNFHPQNIMCYSETNALNRK